jgi:hypothetical protein
VEGHGDGRKTMVEGVRREKEEETGKERGDAVLKIQ